VLRARQFLGALGRDEVGAGSRAQDQGTPGEHADRPRAVEQFQGDVFVGVPGSG
jgi:hypothetical protein